MRSDTNGVTLDTSTSPKNGELSRLITAAVVNQEFCKLLLTDPGQALAKGYKGESFYLAPEEQALLLSIRASSLAELATKLAGGGNGHQKNGYTNGTNGHNGHGINGRNGYRNGHNGYNNGFKETVSVHSSD